MQETNCAAVSVHLGSNYYVTVPPPPSLMYHIIHYGIWNGWYVCSIVVML